MASLEGNQGRHNTDIVDIGNTFASLDAKSQLLQGAEDLAAGKTLGLSEEETLAAISRRRRHQKPVRMSNDEIRQAQQRYATITGADGTVMPGELTPGMRSVPNDQVQFEQDNGERDQSSMQEFTGSLDERIAEQSKARRTSKKGGRDTNRFITFDRMQGRMVEEIIPDGQPTPDDLRDQALLADFGLQRVKTGREPVHNKAGAAVFNEDGEQIFRNTYDFENMAAEGGGSQGWSGGAGGAAADAYKQLEVAIQLGKITPEEAAPLMERLRRTADPAFDKAHEAREGRKAVIIDSMRFSPEVRERNDQTAEAAAIAGIDSGTAKGAEYIPGSLTKASADPEGGVATRALRAESDARFGARPQAVPLNEEALAIAAALGDDVTGYVDADTGLPVDGTTPTRLQTNTPNTNQQLNAPMGTGASWVIANQLENGTDGGLRQANISQATADFSRRVQAFAPGYRSRPVTGVEDFMTQIGRVIEARQQAGGNFYLRNPQTGRNQKVEPSIESALQLLRMSEGQKSELASALLQRELAQTAGLGSAASPGVTVNRGSMFGSEDLDLGRAPRDTVRAAFARLDDPDAQMPIIGAIRERDENGAVVREQPQPTRQVMKGRTPSEAVQVYAAQRRKRGEKPSRARAREIFRGNASLRRDQEKTDIMNQIRALNQQSTTGAPPPRVAEDQQFSEEQGGRATRQMELAEKARLAGPQPGGALVAMPRTQSPSGPTQYYDGNSEFDVVNNFQDTFTGPGGGGPKSPPSVGTYAPEPEPNNDNGRSFRASVADAIRMENRNRRRRNIGGAAGAAAGLGLVAAALNGGKREEEEVYA